MATIDFCCIIRPYTSGPNHGYWYVQDDIDHAPLNVAGVSQGTWDMHINFPTTYGKVGSVIVQADDGFAQSGIYAAAGGVGLGSARITLYKDKIVNGVIVPEVLNPGSITDYMTDLSNGNLWIRGVMHS